MTINVCEFLELKLSANTDTSWEERIIESQYRSGNAQRAYSGIKNSRRVVSLDFMPMNLAEKNKLEDFFIEVGLVLYFIWTATDGEIPVFSANADVWRFSTPVSIKQNADLYTASAVVEEVPNGTADDKTPGVPYTADPVPEYLV